MNFPFQKEIKCPICGEIATLREPDFPGYREPHKFNIYNCRKCDTSFSRPAIKDPSEIYDLIYRNIKSIPTYYRYFHYAENVLIKENPIDYLASQEESYWSIKQALSDKIKIKRDNLILEIGCGLGYLTYSLNKAGYKCNGIDISSESIDYAISNYGYFYECADLKEYSSSNMGKYDIIIMTEVLEHVFDIKEFLFEAKSLLKSNGKIILTTPNKTIFKDYSNWFTELPPVHSWWLSETSLKNCALLLNMNIDFIDFRNFYKSSQCPRIINLKKLTAEIPTFDEYGNLIFHDNSGEPVKPRTKSLLYYLKRIIGAQIYNFLKVLFYSYKRNYKVLGKQGFSICAILSD